MLLLLLVKQLWLAALLAPVHCAQPERLRTGSSFLHSARRIMGQCKV